MANNRCVDPSVASELSVLNILGAMFFCRPGIVERFRPEVNLVDVIPAIKAKRTIKGKVNYDQFPLV